MSEHIDTRAGWTEIPISDVDAADTVYSLAEYDETGAIKRAWVRSEPVLPLPTEQYTVFRVFWPVDPPDLFVTVDGEWYALDGSGDVFTPGNISGYVRFQVLSVSPAADYRAGVKAGAAALIGAIESEPWAREVDLTKWREQFGVTS